MATERMMPLYGIFDENDNLISLANIGEKVDLPAGGPTTSTVVTPTMSKIDIRNTLQTEGAGTDPEKPWGWGKSFILDPGLFEVVETEMPAANSLRSECLGNSVLLFIGHDDVTAETAVLSIGDVARSKRNIRGKGKLENFSIDGNNDDPDAGHGFPVHALWLPPGPGNDGPVPFMNHISGVNATGSGLKIQGRSGGVFYKTGGSGNFRYGLELIDTTDTKFYSPGYGSSALGAVYVEHCATCKFYGGDFWVGNNFTGKWTVTLKHQTNALFDGSEIAGRLGIIGRGETNGNKWEYAKNTFRNINFKIDENCPASYTHVKDNGDTIQVSATVYVEDSDGNDFNNCGLNCPEDTNLIPDYFIHIDTNKTGAGSETYPPFQTFTAMSGLVHFRGRVGQSTPLVGFKVHYSNRPDLIEWTDFTPGALELVRYNQSAPPQNYVSAANFGASTGLTYNKADYPFGYLFATLSTGGTLDDVNTTFTVPPAPSIAPTGMRWMMRVWP